MKIFSLFFLLLTQLTMAGTNRILGGILDAKNEWSSAVAIGTDPENIFCTGVLVEPNKVLTAAHCVMNYPGIGPGQGFVYFGVNHQSGWTSGISAIMARVPKSYNTSVKINQDDFALVLLKKDAPSHIQIIPILKPAEAATFFNQASAKVVQVGYGVREDGQSGEKFYTENKVTQIYQREFLTGAGNGQGVCFGDSGGPSFGKLPNGQWRLVGITSRTPIKNNTCDTNGQFFERADAVYQWYSTL